MTNTGVYAGVWGRPVQVIGTGEANQYENVCIYDTFDFDSIPSFFDINEGAKIWLVPSADIVNGKLQHWNPTEYLFETELI